MSERCAVLNYGSALAGPLNRLLCWTSPKKGLDGVPDESESRVAAICMQKDEGELIRSWILHHANVFGAENIFVLDNVSEDVMTLAVLDWAERCGVNVIRRVEDFERKGIEVSNLIDSLRDQYEWFVPLDSDEFIGVYSDGKLSMERQAILSELQALQPDKIVRMGHYIWAIPGSSLGYYTEARKVIVPSSQKVQLDLGFHLFSWDASSFGNTVDDGLFQPANLCYVHLHNRPYEKALASARKKLARRVKSFSPEDLESYSGAGKHLVRYFFMTPEEYDESFPAGTVNVERCFFDAGLVQPFSPVDTSA